jgi:hypothetical protein
MNNPISEPHKYPYEIVPLIYNNDINVTSINNILLIDSTVRENKIFIDSCNINTFPIVYNHCSNRTELRELLLNKFSLTQLSRIAFVFYNSNMNSKNFLNNYNFFEYEDISENPVFSENVQFLINLIKEFNIKHIDYLACNSLQYDNWNKYYDLLKTNTNVIVGASNDETGNIKYGGDWIMENTSEYVKNIYFNENIENYTSTLITTVAINSALSINNNIYIKQLTNGAMYYSTTNNADDNITTGTWIQINAAVDWQVTIANTNTTPSNTNRLVITFLTNIILNHVDNNFFINSTFITMNGNNKIFYINNITDWKGLLQNAYLKGDIIIQNFITSSIGNPTLNIAARAGYLVGSDFLREGKGINIIEKCVNNCDLTNGPHGGIIGSNCFYNTQSISTNIIRNCINNGNNITESPNYSGGAGGIAGPSLCTNDGNNTIENCINNGTILSYGSGIFAGNSFCPVTPNVNNPSKYTVKNCVNNGNQTGTSFGICESTGACNILNCYSIGNISDNNSGIIGGVAVLYTGTFSAFTVNLTNCYTLYGRITNNNTGMVIKNCYIANTNWITADAKTTLLLDTNAWAFQRINGITDKTLPFQLLSLNPNNLSVYTDTIPCFNNDTKILTSNGYIPIQNLRKGDAIKTLLHGYVPIDAIGYRDIYNTSSNNKINDKLYVCTKSEYSEIIEDLIITGSHSILVDEFKQGEQEETIKILGKIYVTDNKYRLPACVDSRAKPYNIEGTFTIYHIALKHDNYFMNYGIYANGLLVETCSKRYLTELSNMTLIE